MLDEATKLDISNTIDPAVLSSDTNGAAVDASDCHAVTHVVTIGEGGITFGDTNKIEFVLQDSPNGSDWSPVTDAAHVTGLTVSASGIFATINGDAAEDQAYAIGYVGPQRYTRVVVDFSGTHGSGTPIGAVAIKSHLRKSN